MAASSIRFLLALALLAAATNGQTCPAGTETNIDANFAANYEVYSPGRQVKRWQNAEFETNQEYAMTIVNKRIIPVAVVGFILWFLIVCWSCCRCCCGKCRIEDASDKTKKILFFSVIGLAVASMIMVIVGFSYDSKQSDAMASVPGVVDSFVGLLDDIKDGTNAVIGDVNSVTNALAELNSAPPGSSGQLNDLTTQLQEIVDTAGQTNLDSFRDDFSSEIEKIDTQRSRGFRAILGVLCGIIILMAVIAIWNSREEAVCQPRSNLCGRCVTFIVALLTMILVLLLWILAAITLGLATGVSDFCYRADSNILSVTNLELDPTKGASADNAAAFFVSCDSDTNIRTCFNPFASEISQIQSTLDDLVNDFASFKTACEGAPGTCGTQEELDNVETAIDNLEASVGTLIRTLLGCRALNARYQQVMILVCNDFGEALGDAADLFLGFACIFVLTEIFSRLLSDTWRSDDKSEVV